MGVQVPIGEAQCAIEFQCAGRPDVAVTTIGVRPSGGLTAPEIADAVYTAVVSSGIWGITDVSNQWTFNGVRAALQTSAGFITGEELEAEVGEGSWGPPPPQCAVLVQKRTGFGGRQNRGRMFVPPFHLNESTDVSAAGEINGTRRDELETIFDDFVSDLGTANVPAVLFHEDGSASTVITSLTVLSRLATQRSRIR
uniref:Uncharacterized protein n=1 Tax=uncultured prokaryote TaxID=198431 RepID=A0A0H5Q5W3_9ZZZZ|nr:hypothetical protein [uncultured prokaryote]